MRAEEDVAKSPRFFLRWDPESGHLIGWKLRVGKRISDLSERAPCQSTQRETKKKPGACQSFHRFLIFALGRR